MKPPQTSNCRKILQSQQELQRAKAALEVRGGPQVRHAKQARRRVGIDNRPSELGKPQRDETREPSGLVAVEQLAPGNAGGATGAEEPSRLGGEIRRGLVPARDARGVIRAVAHMAQQLEDIGRDQQVQMRGIRMRELRQNRGSDGIDERVPRVLVRALARHLGNCARRGQKLVRRLGAQRCRHQVGLGHDIQVAPMRQEQVDLAAQLAARRQPAPRLAGALGDGANLPPVLPRQREDEVGLLEFGLIEHDGLRAIRAATGHGSSRPDGPPPRLDLYVECEFRTSRRPRRGLRASRTVRADDV